MNEESMRLVARMVLNTMVGQKERVRQLHEAYLREKHLYITIREYTEWRKKTA